MPPLPQIKIYAQRDFGEKINVTFRFVVENWKPFLKYFTVLMLPFCILQAFVTTYYIQDVQALSDPGAAAGIANEWGSLLASYGLLMAVAFVGGSFCVGLCYTLVRLYAARADGLKGLSFQELAPHLWPNVGRGLKAALWGVLVVALFAFAMGALSVVSAFFVLLGLLGLLAALVPMTLFAPAYMLDEEHRSGWYSLKWSFRQGFRFWGSCALLFLVVGLIAGIVQGFLSIPMYAVAIAGALIDTQGGVAPAYLATLLFAFGILQTYGSYLASLVVMVAATFQYGHVRERTEAPSVNEDIEHFEQF